MEYVVNIVAAPVDEAQAVADSECPLDEWRGIDAPGVTSAMLAQIESTLTGAALSESLDRCEPLAWGEGGASVLRLDDALGERLVACDEEMLARCAEELAGSEAFENEAWAEEEILSLLLALHDLAESAEDEGAAFFVWLCAC